MFDAKATDNSIDKSDDKNDEENDVVQNICSGLRFQIIDVHPTDDQEEQAHYHLILKASATIMMIVIIIIKKDCLLTLVKSRLALGSPSCSLVRLFVCSFVHHHAENGFIHRKMEVDCHLVITSKVKLFFRPGKRNE